jgi:hypothetical protein
MVVPSALQTPFNDISSHTEAKHCQLETYLAVWREAISMRRAVLAVRLPWSASSLADFEDRWVLREGGDSHGAHEAEGEGCEDRELHFETMGVLGFGFFGSFGEVI